MRSAYALALFLAAAPAFAQDAAAPTGDAAKGEGVFRQCQACHVVADADGNVLAGRSGRVGPNLFGINGSAAGAQEGFRYSELMHEAAEKGLVWNEETFVAYVQNPTNFLREYSGESGGRSNMTFQLRKEEDAVNLWAYIVSLAPAE